MRHSNLNTEGNKTTLRAIYCNQCFTPEELIKIFHKSPYSSGHTEQFLKWLQKPTASPCKCPITNMGRKVHLDDCQTRQPTEKPTTNPKKISSQLVVDWETKLDNILMHSKQDNLGLNESHPCLPLESSIREIIKDLLKEERHDNEILINTILDIKNKEQAEYKQKLLSQIKELRIDKTRRNLFMDKIEIEYHNKALDEVEAVIKEV